eukprot:scaffold1462_cov202-Prasinococcus_capsulatus_cf.AAC.2
MRSAVRERSVLTPKLSGALQCPLLGLQAGTRARRSSAARLPRLPGSRAGSFSPSGCPALRGVPPRCAT